MTFEDYLMNIPLLHSWDGGLTWGTGGFGKSHLEALYNFLRKSLPPRPVMLETGAGNSTITMLFLNPGKLISIAPDAQLFGRINAFCRNNEIPDAALESHIEGSQWVLPRLAAENRMSDPLLDFALIDGCHGWPTCFVDLEYINSMLRPGGYLMIDDVQLHAEKEMARFLSEQPGFSLALDLQKSLVFRKVTADRFLGEWTEQPYIVRRTREYDQRPNSFALEDPGIVSRVAHCARASLRRLLCVFNREDGKVRALAHL